MPSLEGLIYLHTGERLLLTYTTIIPRDFTCLSFGKKKKIAFSIVAKITKAQCTKLGKLAKAQRKK